MCLVEWAISLLKSIEDGIASSRQTTSGLAMTMKGLFHHPLEKQEAALIKAASNVQRILHILVQQHHLLLLDELAPSARRRRRFDPVDVHAWEAVDSGISILSRVDYLGT